MFGFEVIDQRNLYLRSRAIDKVKFLLWFKLFFGKSLLRAIGINMKPFGTIIKCRPGK